MSLYDTEIIDVCILGSNYKMHKGIVDDVLITGSLSSDRFVDLYNFTIDYSPISPNVADNIFHTIYKRMNYSHIYKKYTSKQPPEFCLFFKKYLNTDKFPLPRNTRMESFKKKMQTINKVIKHGLHAEQHFIYGTILKFIRKLDLPFSDQLQIIKYRGSSMALKFGNDEEMKLGKSEIMILRAISKKQGFDIYDIVYEKYNFSEYEYIEYQSEFDSIEMLD